MTYRIRTVAEMTGVPRNTLLAWERRYGLVKPERHENGYRSYSEEDVERLQRVQNAIRSGLKISEAVALLEQEDHSEESSRLARLPTEAGQQGYEAMARDLTDALVSYRRGDADRILSQLLPVPFGTRLHQVFFPVLRMIGDRWESGEVSIAQEHYASAVLRTHLAGVLLGIGTAGMSSPHAACTTFIGDVHELASLALAIQLSLEGYRVSYLGPNLPANEAFEFCLGQRVKLLCVSVIKKPTAAAVNSYMAELAPLVQNGARVVIGGRQLAHLKLAPPEGVELVPHWEDFRANTRE